MEAVKGCVKKNDEKVQTNMSSFLTFIRDFAYQQQPLTKIHQTTNTCVYSTIKRYYRRYFCTNGLK